MEDMSEKLRRFNGLDSSVGIQHILDEAFKVFENPIMMFDTEYRLQAYTNAVSDDHIWNEIITYGSFSHETQVLFMEAGFVDDAANTQDICYMISDRVKYPRLYGKLYNENHIHVSNLIIIGCNRPFTQEDEQALHILCRLISEEIGKSEFYQTYGKLYQETYMRKLIDGEITDKAFYAAHIAIVYNGFKYGLRLIVADVGADNPTERSRLTYFRDTFRRLEAEFQYAIYAKYLLILLSTENDSFEPEKELGVIYELFKENDIRAGVSSSFDNLYELRKYYNEALEALNCGTDTISVAKA